MAKANPPSTVVVADVLRETRPANPENSPLNEFHFATCEAFAERYIGMYGVRFRNDVFIAQCGYLPNGERAEILAEILKGRAEDERLPDSSGAVK